MTSVLTSGNSPAPVGRTSYEIPRSGSSSSARLPLRPDGKQKVCSKPGSSLVCVLNPDF